MPDLDVISGHGPIPYGSQAIPCSSGRYGIFDAFRLQEAWAPGKAVSFENSADAAKYKNIYGYGHASARTEMLGVLTIKGLSPDMAVAVTTSNDTTVTLITDGYAPVSLAPGFAVRAGQYLEPIPAGTYRGCFRPMAAGVIGRVRADVAYDNSAGTAAQWISATITPASQRATGIISKISGDAASFGSAVGDDAEKVITLGAGDSFPTIPANSWTAETVYRLRAKFKFTSANGNDTFQMRARLGGLTGALLSDNGTAQDPTNGGGDKAIIDIVFRPRGTIGAATPIEASGITGLTPGQAGGGIVVAGTVATLPTVDTTASGGLQVVITGEWSAVNAANLAILEEFILEQLA